MDKPVSSRSSGDVDPLKLEHGAIHTSIDLRVYRLVAVQKAAYRFAARGTVMIGSPTETTLPLTFTFAPATTEQTALSLAREFFQELLDQELREHVGDETRALRGLILAHAFSRAGLVERE